jgi:hypothetical protein
MTSKKSQANQKEVCVEDFEKTKEKNRLIRNEKIIQLSE